MTGDMDIAPEALQAIRVGEAGCAVSRNEQIDSLAAILRNQSGIGAHQGPGAQIGMQAALRVAIEIVRGAERVKVRGFDLHRGFGDLDLKTGGFGLFVKIRVSDTAR